METCPLLGEPLRPGETICLTAAHEYHAGMNQLADLLHVVTQVKAGAGGRPTPVRTHPTSKPPLSVGILDEASEHEDNLWHYAREYAGWARSGIPLPPILGALTLQHILDGTIFGGRLTRYPGAVEMIAETRLSLRSLKRLARWDAQTWIPLGPCPHCENPVWAPLEDAVGQCRDCGEIVDVEARKLDVRRSIEDWWLPRPQAREAVRIYAGKPVSDARLRQWISRGKLEVRGDTINVGALIHLAT